MADRAWRLPLFVPGLLMLLAFGIAMRTAGAASPRGGAEERARALLQAEAQSPTSAENVLDRHALLSQVMMAMLADNVPIDDVLPRELARSLEQLIAAGDKTRAAALVAEAIERLGRKLALAPGGEPVPVPALKNVAGPPISVPEPAGGSLPPCAGVSDESDAVLWGAEILPGLFDSPAVKDLASNGVCLKYVKIRLQLPMFTADGKSFTPTACLPSQANCKFTFNLDKAVELAGRNDWSLFPMFSLDPESPVVSESEMASYVAFVDWFVTRYGAAGAVKYIELVNNPVLLWKGSTEQLLALSNRVYERIKERHPQVLVGTPGFEYWADAPASDKSLQEVEYFLDKRNGAKFDFWAFHGYPTVEVSRIREGAFYPPTKRGLSNRYAGISGIAEIRRRLDENGWSGRLIIDTEHTGIDPVGRATNPEVERLDAAYMVQELTLKNALGGTDTPLLAGIIALKLYPRGEMFELAWGSLRPDGSPTRAVAAVQLLHARLAGYRHAARVSGDYDLEEVAWVEKFTAAKGDLFVFFKPFAYEAGKSIRLDGRTVGYTLRLEKTPLSVTLSDINGRRSSLAPAREIRLDAVNEAQFLEVTYR